MFNRKIVQSPHSYTICALNGLVLRMALIGVFSGLFLTDVGFAEERNISQLGDVVVTATRQEKSIADLPGSVSVVTRAEIERSGAVNVPELISEKVGITGNPTTGDGSTIQLSLRGVNPSRSNKILVMVNGVPMNNAWTGIVFWRDLPSPNQIERIEIVKGPVSAIYGSFGLGGCVNIITRRAPAEPETNVETSYGSNNTTIFSVATGRNIKEKFSYQLGASFHKSDGYRDRSAIEDYGLSTKLEWMLSNRSHLELDFGYSKVDNEIAGSLSKEEFEKDPEQAESQFGRREMGRIYSNLTFRRDIGADDNLKTTLYYQSLLNYDYVFTGSDKMCSYDTYTAGGEIQYTLNHTLWGRKNSIVFGPTIRHDNAESKTFPTSNGERSGAATADSLSKPLFWALYAQDEFTISESLSLTLGIRYDEVKYDQEDRIEPDSSGTISMNAFSPMLALSYRLLEKTTLFGNMGKGFAPPTTSRLYGTNGNPDLKPETAINYEVGIRTSSLSWLDLTHTFYLMEVQDEIISAQVDDETMYINAGETRHQGMETELNIRLPAGVTPFANYTYQNVEYIDYRVYSRGEYEVYDGNKVPNVPEQIYTAGIKYQHPVGLNFRLSARYEDEKYTHSDNAHFKVPSFTIWNAKLGYEGKIKDIGYSAYLAGENLFDKNYYYKGSSSGDVYPAAPQTFTFGLSFTL